MTDTTREALAVEAKRLARECAQKLATPANWHALDAAIDRLATPEQAPAVQAGALDLDVARCGPVTLEGELRFRHQHDLATPGYKGSVLCARTEAALATTPAVQAEQPAEPLFLLHCGKVDGSGEQDEWDIEADSGKRVDEFAARHPGKTIPLYAAPRGQAEDAQRLDAERWRYVRDHWSNVQFRYNRDPANSLKSLTLTIKADHYTGGNAEYIERDIDAARASDARKDGAA